MDNMEAKLRALLKSARNCPVCTQVMLEGFVVPGCQVLHMACKDCCSKAKYCTQCKMNLAYSPLGPMAAAFLQPGAPATGSVPVATVAPQKKKTTLCCFSVNGCEFNCPDNFLNSHQLECRYRKYDCLGKSTDSFKCDWQGLQEGLIQHTQSAHPTNWGNLSFKTDSFVSINQAKEMQVFTAHGKSFVYVMKKDQTKNRFYWIILLVGTKKESEKYIYEFEIYKPGDDVRKIKFVEFCESDATPLTEVVSSERCVVISENLLRTYLVKGKVHYRFWIKNIEKGPKPDKDGKKKDNENKEDKNVKKDVKKGPPKKPHPVQLKKKSAE